MPVVNDFTLLSFFHDADCNSLCWNCQDPSIRRVIFDVKVDDDIEFDTWVGQNVSLVFSDVVACRFVGWGVQIGQERIDTILEDISTELTDECKQLQSAGYNVPPFRFTIVLGSGSTIELVCQEVAVEMR